LAIGKLGYENVMHVLMQHNGPSGIRA